jgi:multiple sugar transport system substrate-binding protein
MRNWPYAYAIGKDNKDAPEFEVAPFPEFEGAGKGGILGGHNLVVSAYSKNPGGSLALIDYLTSEESIKRDATDFSLAPVLQATYDDPAVQKALPFSKELNEAIAQAGSRPVSPVYTQISQAIYKNVNQALSGQVSPEEALKNGQAEMEQALATF